MKVAVVMLLRGLLHRWWLSCGVIALTTAAVVAAAIGPIYLSSSMTSLRVDRLAQQSNTNKSMSWSFVPDAGASWEQIRADVTKATGERVDTTYYPDAQVSWLSKDREIIRQGRPMRWNFETRESACEHLDVASGRCPRAAGEIMVSTIDVERGGLRVGSPVDLGLGRPLRVVGSYRLDEPGSAYWFDPVRYESTPQQGQPGSSSFVPYTPAPFFVVADQVAALPESTQIVRGDRVLRVPHDFDQPTLERLADAAIDEAERDPVDVHGGRLGSADKTQLGAIRDEIADETDVATRTILPASLSLILVCIIVQFRLVSAAADLRRPEIALHKVRGWSRRRLRAITLTEPLLLLAVGGTLGVLAARPLGSCLASMWLRSGTPAEFSTGALGMTLLVVVASVVATILATRAVAGESLRRQLEPTSAPPEPGRAIRVLRLLVVVAAVVTVAVAMTRERSTPSLVDQSMPAVVGLAAAVLATAVTVWAARRLVGHTARQASTVRFLQARAITRRREGALLVVPVTVALTVSAFAVGVWSTADQWRESASAAEVGADRSYAAPMSAFEALTLTHRVDPDGDWLMATAYDVMGDDVRILVDSPRLPAVASWPDSWTGPDTVDAVADELAPVDAPQVTDGNLSIEATSDLRSGERIYITLSLLTSTGQPQTVSIGPYPNGRQVRSATVSGCGAGCEVTRMQIGGVSGILTPLEGTIEMGPVKVDGEPRSMLATGDDSVWEAAGDVPGEADIDIDAAPSGLTLAIDSGGEPSALMLEPSGTPDVVPVVAGRESPTLGVGADGDSAGHGTPSDVDVERVRTAEAVPVVGSTGYMADLSEMVRESPQSWGRASVRILATDDVPDSVVRELERAGVETSDPIRLSEVRSEFDNEAYALSLRLYVLAAAATLTLAVIGLVVSLAVQVRARRRDAAALRVTGVRERAVWLATVLELGAVIAVATAFGTAAGAGAAQVVVRGTRLGTVDVGTPRVLTAIDPGTLGMLFLGVLAVLIAVSALISRRVVRSGRPSALRG